ncbi:MAG: Hsp70 family protein [Planctomycetaceae bacterium]|nr:Hsp70 family protein [Planctomycetaceae bacterium]
MKQTQAVGIDLGTTYSCIAWLNEHGQPVTIPNQEGELSTPSVVFFDGGQPIVGTEALRNAIAAPDRVVQHAKRYMGDANKFWKIGDARFSPVHISGLILRKLIAAAQEQIGEIREAVITVPAQFSDAQRHATLLAGHAAGLERIEMINEPVAAALCHVLGNEGLAFTELAIDQQLLVFDLGGGTLDLAIVRYRQNEVKVVASDGDLELGGLDWTKTLVDLAAEKFIAEFGKDPRTSRESLQFLTIEAEQAKRSLSVRPRAAITVRHEGLLKTFQIEQAEFEKAARRLVQRCEEVTRRILKDNKFGWAHVDVVLTTGGASRMPMIRDSLKKLSGRTLNTSLSPDQSIAHGAAYYAGMLLANQEYVRTVFNSKASSRLARVRQQSVNARSLGILIRDEESGQRVPHYLIPANTALPVSRTHLFGTVVANQTRVHVRIVESGAGADRPPTVLGDCVVTDLPPNLPEGTEIEVTISYDHQARVHVSARELSSGRHAEVEIIRQENVNAQLEQKRESTEDTLPPVELSELAPPNAPATGPSANANSAPQTSKADAGQPVKGARIGDPEFDALHELSAWNASSDKADVIGDQPVLLCNSCGAALGRGGVCAECGAESAAPKRPRQQTKPTAPKRAKPPGAAGARPSAASDPPPRKARRTERLDTSEAEFWDLVDGDE